MTNPLAMHSHRQSHLLGSIAIITIKSTHFNSSSFHLLNVHAYTAEYLADDLNMAHLRWKQSKYIWSITIPFPPVLKLVPGHILQGFTSAPSTFRVQRKLWVLSDPSFRISGEENTLYVFSSVSTPKTPFYKHEREVVPTLSKCHLYIHGRDRIRELYLTLV